MKNGQPESLAEALLLIEKMKGQLSEKNEKIENRNSKFRINISRGNVIEKRTYKARNTSKKGSCNRKNSVHIKRNRVKFLKIVYPTFKAVKINPSGICHFREWVN